ncbi:MAG: FtsW/RodA/SpoVE family cell cycle protein [Defluviitaleaceae bacterium]|nr:FtsW/RodA/SpoVE family cell cycle protein [Defluviitaleaceae bacterium]
MTKKQAIIRGLKSFDYLLALCVIGVGIFGVAMIYTSSNHIGMPAREAALFGGLWRQQRMFIITGTVLMLIFACIDYRHITRLYLFIYGFMMLLLIAVMLIGADDATSTARWLPIPMPVIGPLSLQPSEFAKIFMILFLSKFLDVKKDDFNRIHWLILVLIAIAVPFYLVLEQPSLSAALVVLFVSIVILFTAGLKLRYILLGILVITPILVLIWFDLQRETPIILGSILRDYQLDRIQAALSADPNPDAVLQVAGSRRAIASGGLTGQGFRNNQIYLIVAHNDLIFSVMAEQFGFVGGVVLIGIVMLMVIKCLLIGLRAIDIQGRLIAVGVAGLLIFETFVHVGVVTGLLPTTGMPFPFLSYGGSMIWVHMIAMGIVLNIGLKRDVDELTDDDIVISI